ncbi:MAG: hypothetical protein J6U48_04560, partial [Alistipes sp.]|nr:hypothetical protein [Alistipes sp.]
MRKFFTNIKAIATSVAVMACVSISVSSCSYDDTELWNEIESIKQDIADLRLEIENELNAVKDLINGLTTIKSVEQTKDGYKVITLSDGTKINVYPKGSGVPSQIVTVVSEDGVLYWAMYDGLGNANPIMIGGQKVPVADAAPQTQVVDGAIEVSFDGGKTWIKTGYTESVADSIIRDVEVVYSDWQTDGDGNPVALYCKVTLADGSVIKVGMQNGKLVLPFDMMFVPYGSEMMFVLEVDDVADFITTSPRGWECEAELNAKHGLMTLNFTAPSYEDVQSGVAPREGVAKVMIVFNNGSSAIASIKLTTNPAKVNFTKDGVYIEAGYGTNYLLCGIIASKNFNPTNIINNCTKALSSESAVSGVHQIAFMETNEVYVPYNPTLRTSPLTVGDEYSFWYIAPRNDEEGGLFVNADELVVEKYTHSSVSFSTTAVSFFDVDVKFDVKGSAGYMLGFERADEFDAEALA